MTVTEVMLITSSYSFLQGSRAQLLAAAALKRLAWRFHTRYHMWFQRERNPDEINDRHERVSVTLKRRLFEPASSRAHSSTLTTPNGRRAPNTTSSLTTSSSKIDHLKRW